MPKIDWRDDDDQPRGEPFGRPQRRRVPFSLRPRTARWDFATGLPAAPFEPPLPATRRPLHLIWGPPEPRTR